MLSIVSLCPSLNAVLPRCSHACTKASPSTHEAGGRADHPGYSMMLLCFIRTSDSPAISKPLLDKQAGCLIIGTSCAKRAAYGHTQPGEDLTNAASISQLLQATLASVSMFHVSDSKYPPDLDFTRFSYTFQRAWVDLALYLFFCLVAKLVCASTLPALSFLVTWFLFPFFAVLAHTPFWCPDRGLLGWESFACGPVSPHKCHAVWLTTWRHCTKRIGLSVTSWNN